MKYKMVTVYQDEDSKLKKAKVETEIGNIEVTDVDKYNKLMSEFAHQEGISVDDLLKRNDLVRIVYTKEATLPSTDLTDEEYDEIVFGALKEDKKKKTKKKSGFVKKLVACGIIIGVLGTGAYHLDKFHNVFNGRVFRFFNPDKKVEESNNNENSSFNKGDTIISNNKSFTIVESGNKNDVSEYDKTMEGVMDRQEKTENIISQLDNNVVEMTEEDILEALNDNARIANSSIFEVSEFINEKGLNGKAYYYNFEKNFAAGSYDYNAVKVFSDMRNEVLKAAFEEKSIKLTKSKIRDFYSFYAEVVTLDKKCTVGNMVVDFSELSDMAKATVLELGVSMLKINLENYEYIVDGKTLSKEAINDDAVEMLEGDLIPTLINKGYRK